MANKISVKIVLLILFLITQIIGIAVLNEYNKPIIDINQINATGDNATRQLPFNLEESNDTTIWDLLLSILLAFILFFTLMRYKLKYIIKSWFFIIIVLAITVSLNAFLDGGSTIAQIVALTMAIPLTILKLIRPSVIIHNGTELLIYPGIAAIISTLMNPLGIIVVLILIAIYDAWAVWKSGIMQKMAKYQMEEVKIFGGFLIPLLDKKTKLMVEKLKQNILRQN